MPSHAAATQWCDVCGGPCREPLTLPPIHASYPFMTPEQIAMTHPPVDQPPAPAEPVVKRGGKRMHRGPDEDRMKRPSEDR